MRSPTTRDALNALYARERKRLKKLAEADSPQGEYSFPVFGCGDEGANILLVGEAPGAEETKRETPFVGKAGRQLDALFSLFGVLREQVYITNVVKYRPVVRGARSTRNRTPGRAEIEGALPLLAGEIKLLSPRWILTLGNTPLRAICALAGEKPLTIGAAHGTAIPLHIARTSVVLIPLYHPASVIYNPALKETLRADAENVRRVLYKADRLNFGELSCYTDSIEKKGEP